MPGPARHLLPTFARFVVDRPRSTLLLLGLICPLAGWLALGVPLDNDPRAFVAQDSEATRFLDQHTDVFGATDTRVLVILSDEGAGAAVLQEVAERLADDLEALPQVEGVASLPTTPLARRVNENEVLVEPLLGSRTTQPLPITDALAQATSSRLGLSRLVTPDGSKTLLAARLGAEFSDPVTARPVLGAIRGLAQKQVQKSEGRVSARLAGVPPTRIASIENIERDLTLLIPITMLLLALCLYAQFRSVAAVVLPLAAVCTTVLLSMGVAGLLGFSLNPITQVAPLLIMVITVADAVHLLARYQEGTDSGLQPREALITSIRSVGTACALTTATSAIAFLSLLHTRMDILHDFGILTAVSIVLGLGVTLTLVPAGLRLSGARPKGRSPRVEGAIRQIVTMLIRPRVAPLVVTAGIILALSAGVLSSGAKIDFFLKDLLATADPVSEGNLMLDQELGGMLPIELHLLGKNGDFHRPEVLSALAQLEDFLTQQGLVAPLGPAGLVRELSAVLHGVDELPEDASKVSTLLLFSEFAGQSGGQQLIAEGASQARIITSSPDLGAAHLMEQAEAIDAKAKSLLGPLGITGRLTGVSIITASGFNTLASELIVALLFALGVIVLAVGVLFRSARMALASLLPNALPMLLALGWFGATGRPIDLFPAILLTIAVGIAVDDTIHLLARYREELSRSRTHEDAIREATVHCVGAITNTSVILGLGFSVLTLSTFPANVTTGILGASIIVMALLADLIFAPAILAVLRPGQPGRTAQEAT
jgi:predicted RND superfamily exporter protein